MHKGGIVFAFAVLSGSVLGASSGCSSSNSIKSTQDGGGTGLSCSNPLAVEKTGLQQCTSCSASAQCTAAQPLEACCTWVAAPHDALAVGAGLHRYTTTSASTPPSLGCLDTPGTLDAAHSQKVTLTGYVWLFSSGGDSQSVKVEVFAEHAPNTDGSIDPAVIGTYTTSQTDAFDPVDTTWNHNCPNGCQYRQYTIQNVPTETPLVIKTSDAGGGWATLYDYNIYFPNSAVQGGKVTYDATAVAGPDLSTVAGTVGQIIQSGKGLLAGEVHDCSDVRLFGATVGLDMANPPQLFYFTEDEGNPLPSQQTGDTSHLGLFGSLNLPTGSPIRVSAIGQDQTSPGQYLMLGTYVVQVYPGAVTAISLRGRRPWQP